MLLPSIQGFSLSPELCGDCLVPPPNLHQLSARLSCHLQQLCVPDIMLGFSDRQPGSADTAMTLRIMELILSYWDLLRVLGGQNPIMPQRPILSVNLRQRKPQQAYHSTALRPCTCLVHPRVASIRQR